MTRVLVSAASRHGATEEIAAAIGAGLRERGFGVDIRDPASVTAADGYDAFVLGSAVYLGHWLAPATELAERIGPAIDGRPVWLFSSGPVGDQSRKMVQQMGADPVDLPDVRRDTGAERHQMFAGKLDRKELGFFGRIALFFVRGLDGDFRDWAAIAAWTDEIAAALRRPVGSGARST